MGERGDFQAMLKQHDINRFNETWGKREPDTIFEAMQMTREVYDADLPIRELADKLGERFLIVPGENEVGLDQLTTLINGYMANKEGWDALLDGRKTE